MEEEKGFALHYDDVAQYLFEALTGEGYVPETDELLDLTEIVIDLILTISLTTGLNVFILEDELGEEE